MQLLPPLAVATLAFGVLASGCTCDSPSPGAPAAPSSALGSASAPAVASAKPARTPRPTGEVPKPESFHVKTSDGVRIEASRYSGGDATAPVVVLTHRLGGTQEEYKPLLQRLFPPKHPMNVIAFDLRGHGASKGKRPWPTFEPSDFEAMDRDLEAIRNHLTKDKKGAPTTWVLVGSDLGATLAVRHAAKVEGVAGVALVSPGASLRGLDLYKPFGAVLKHPNLILAGEQDNVSKHPAKALAAMSKSSKLVTFNERGHGAQSLGKARWEMWDELADWVEARVSVSAPPSSSASSAAPATSVPPSASSAPSSGR